jgi:hypothetical protein
MFILLIYFYLLGKMDSENYNQIYNLNELNDSEAELSNRSSNCLLESDGNEELSFGLNLIPQNNLSKKAEVNTIEMISETKDLNLNTPIQIKTINWKDEIYKGNFMPAFCLLNSNKLLVDEIIDYNTENRLLHMSLSFSFTNVTRGLIELFKSELNIKNRFGHTPFHILCNKEQSDIFLFSYMIKNEDLQFDERDRNGVTPLFFIINSKHKLEFLILMYKQANIYNIDNIGNSAIYFILSSDNKFVLNFILRHCPKLNINSRYYGNKACLSEVLITCKGRSVSKHLMKYHHHKLELESILGSQKSKDKFNFYNNFNYDLFNTLYFYKTKNYIGFINKIFSKDKLNNYTFVNYNIKFLLFDLILPNMNEKLKYLLITSYLFLNLYVFTILIKDLNIGFYYDEKNGLDIQNILFLLYQTSSFIGLFLAFCYFYFKRTPKSKSCYNNEAQLSINIENSPYYSDSDNDKVDNIDNKEFDKRNSYSRENKNNFKEPYYKFDNCQHNSDNVLNIIYQAVERNPLDIVFEDELCEICLIKKEKSTNHCYICNRCVNEFYFHSKLFNLCFHRTNIYFYILFYSSLMAVQFSFVYLIAIKLNLNYVFENGLDIKETLYDSNYITTNIITFFLNLNLKEIVYVSYSIIFGVMFFQQWFVMLLCYGYKTTYYNMFRMHKKCVGKFEQRKGKICNIPIVNTVSICEFFLNLFKR